MKRKSAPTNNYDLRRRTSSNDSDSVVFVSATKRKQEVMKAKKQIFNRMQSLALGKARALQRGFSHLSTQTDETSFNCLCCERNSCPCLPGPSRRVQSKALKTKDAKDIQTLYENERCKNKDTQTINTESSSEVFQVVAGDSEDRGYLADISASDTNPETNQHTVGVSANDKEVVVREQNPRVSQGQSVFLREVSQPVNESTSESATTTSGSVASMANDDAPVMEVDNTHGFGDGVHNDPLQVEIIDLGEMSVSEYLENLR